MTINDSNWQFLHDATGLSLPFNDMYFRYLRDQGYTGTLQDMIAASGFSINPSGLRNPANPTTGLITPPIISGIQTTEQTLTTTLATWSRTPVSRTRQWWRADSLTVGVDPITDDEGNTLYLTKEYIPGATSTTYQIAIADRGYVIGVDEFASFGGLVVTAQSVATDMIEYTDLLAGAGSFTSNIGWTLPTGWTIAGGLLTGLLTANTATHAVIAPAATIRLQTDVKRLVAGTVTLRLSGPPHGVIAGAAFTAVGDNQFVDLVTTGNNTIGVVKSATFNGDIDNLVAYRIA